MHSDKKSGQTSSVLFHCLGNLIFKSGVTIVTLISIQRFVITVPDRILMQTKQFSTSSDSVHYDWGKIDHESMRHFYLNFRHIFHCNLKIWRRKNGKEWSFFLLHNLHEFHFQRLSYWEKKNSTFMVKEWSNFFLVHILHKSSAQPRKNFLKSKIDFVSNF